MRRERAGGYPIHVLGLLAMIAVSCLIAFGGGAFYELLSASFVAGRAVIESTLWALFR